MIVHEKVLSGPKLFNLEYASNWLVMTSSLPNLSAMNLSETGVHEASSGDSIESLILSTLSSHGSIEDSFAFATLHNLDHQAVIGTLKSLTADQYCVEEPLSTTCWSLTEEGVEIMKRGSPEYQVFHAIPSERGIDVKVLQDSMGEIAKIGLGPCMKNKWVVKKGDQLLRAVESIQDLTAAMLSSIHSQDHSSIPEEEMKNLKKRKLVQQVIRKSYRILKGKSFQTTRKKKFADLTRDMLGNRNDVILLLYI